MSSASNVTAAFGLMDGSSTGRINLAAIDVFTVNLESPPSKDKVRVLFKESDVESRGDLDYEQFLHFCGELEKISKCNADAMCQQFRTSFCKKLFTIVDDGVGSAAGGNGVINKEELRSLYDSQFEVINSGLTVTAFARMLGEWPGEEINFEQFQKVISTVIGSGMDISTALAQFEKATAERKSGSKRALDRLRGAAKQVKDLNAGAKKLDALYVGHSVPPPDASVFANDIFREAFCLLDSRGSGAISMDSVYEFCDSLPVAPASSAVKKIYNQFDEDGSGDIDSEEFTGFCKALEQLTKMTAADMVNYYTTAQYRRLFELVDDGGDGNDMVSKDELKILLENISPMLTTRYSAADVHNLVRDYKGDLNFDDFCDVVKKLTVGKSISQVVSAFEEARRRRKAAKHNAFTKFEHGGAKSSANPKIALPVESVPEDRERICFSCFEKDDTIKEQAARIDKMQAELDTLRASASAAESELESAKIAVQWATNGGGAGGDEPTGNPFAKIRSTNLLHAASTFQRYPEFIKPAVLEHSTIRVLDHARFFCAQMVNGKVETEGVIRSCVELLPSALDHIHELAVLVDDSRPSIETVQVYIRQLLDSLKASGSGKLEGTHQESVINNMEILQSLRDNLKSAREGINWALEQVVSSRAQISDAAATVAPGSCRAKEIMETLIEFEFATQDIMDRVTVLMMYGSDHVSDAEFYCRRLLTKQQESLSPTEISDLETVLGQTDEQLKQGEWDACFSKLRKTTDQIGRHMTLGSQSQSRSKAIQTLPQVDMRPLTGLKKHGDHDRTSEWDDGKSAFSTPRSAAPRSRTLKLDPRNMAAHMEKVLDRYVGQEGVTVPSNFKRIEGKGEHCYQFGSKKIELMPVDRFVAVKVGGGYLLFDEFCERYCAQENRRFTLEVNATPTPSSIRRSATPTYGRSTPGTTSPGSSTPRVLVRHGGSLKLSDGHKGGFGSTSPH